MANVLLSGPAGAGKSQEARRLLEAATEPTVAADFQSILAALVLLERDPVTGRYPPRRASQASWLLPLAEHVRQTVIRAAQERGVDVIATNSDGSPERRALLLSRLGPRAAERVIDPGFAVVAERLSVDGVLDEQCKRCDQPLVREAVAMDELTFEIRQMEDPTRESPGRLVGTLITYEERAHDRPEVFVRGALTWPENGILVNEQHNRQAPILRVIPFLDGDELKIDAALPNTQRGRDTVENLRQGVYTGLSVEFQSRSEGRRGPLREIRSAILGGAALVDTAAYRGSTVEVRAEQAIDQLIEVARRWL